MGVILGSDSTAKDPQLVTQFSGHAHPCKTKSQYLNTKQHKDKGMY